MKKLFVISALILLACGWAGSALATPLTCWFPPDWKTKTEEARTIAKALTEKSGIQVNPRIAKSYPEILEAFAAGKPELVYVGSFVQAILKARDLGVPLVQNVNGKELYSGILIYPQGENPGEILKNHSEEIAYAVGASSGESSAKAATSGKASMGVANHAASAGAVKAGKAKAGVVKNWWWASNQEKYPGLAVYEIPGVSLRKNPDNVLTASKAVPADVRKKIAAAAVASKDAFGAPLMVPFDGSALDFSLELMRKGKIDPLTYTW